MADRQLTLGVDIDDASISRGKKRLEELERAQKRLADAQAKYANDSSKASKAIQDGIEKRSKELTKEQIRLERALKNTSKAFIEQQTAAGRAAQGVEKAQSASTARRGGLAPGGGGGGSERLRTIGRDIRGLPSVQVPGLGIGTDTFGRAAEVMGRLGVSVSGLATAAGVAIPVAVAFGLAFQEWQRTAEKARIAQEGFNKTLLELTQMEVQGATSADIEKEGERLNQALEAAELGLERLTLQYELQVKELGPLEEFWSRLTSSTEEQLKKDIEAADAQAQTAFGAIQAFQEYTGTLDETTIAANDAAAAEKALAAERTQTVITNAEQAAELEAQRRRFDDATRGQIDAEIQAIQDRIATQQTYLDSLVASGDTSEEVAKRIAALREEISFLGEKSNQLQTLRSSAKTDEQAAKEKKLASARQEAALASDKAFQAEIKRIKGTEEAASASRRTSPATGRTIGGLFAPFRSQDDKKAENEAEKAREKSREIEQKYRDDLLEAQIDFNREQEKEARRAEFELAKIGKEAKRAEQDAIRERNFAAAADARENAKEQESDLHDQLKFEQREREIAYRQQQDDLRRNQQNQLRDLQNSLQQRNQMEVNFMQNSINVWQQYFNRLSGMQAQAAGSGSTRQASGGNQSLSMNALSYVTG